MTRAQTTTTTPLRARARSAPDGYSYMTLPANHHIHARMNTTPTAPLPSQRYRKGPRPKSQHDNLHNQPDPQNPGHIPCTKYCWCMCSRCWDLQNRKCICSTCSCRVNCPF